MSRRRIERALRYAHEKREEREAAMPPMDENDLDVKPEKGDMFAMLLSGLGIILPVVLAVLLVIVAIGYIFIFR